VILWLYKANIIDSHIDRNGLWVYNGNKQSRRDCNGFFLAEAKMKKLFAKLVAWLRPATPKPIVDGAYLERCVEMERRRWAGVQ
jgi:hypothetical protein